MPLWQAAAQRWPQLPYGKQQQNTWHADRRWPALVVLIVTALAVARVCRAEDAIRPPPAPCVVPVYLVKDACGKAGVTHKCMVWENRYILNVLLAGLPSRCGCHVRLLDRQEAVGGIRSLPTLDAPAVILVAVFGLKAAEEEAIREMGDYAQRKLIVIHLNDEKWSQPHNSSWYPLVKAVFRNYHHDHTTLLQHINYLTAALASNQQPAADQRSLQVATPTTGHGGLMAGQMGSSSSQPGGDNVFWVPLGFGENFFTSDVVQQEFITRPLLWSWVGSVGRKIERQDMVRHMSTPELMAGGYLHVLQTFLSTEMLSPIRYTDLLHQSKLVPLPRGVHWEQYRLWEAFAAGAVPVALEEHMHAGLVHVPLLGFKIMWVDSWQQAPAVLTSVLTNVTLQTELAQWQRHNSVRYKQVMTLVSERVSAAVCLQK